jgi:hypothetical protein
VATPAPNAIVEFFSQRPALTAEVLRAHVDDGTGHCRGCRWWQSAIPTWPCSTWHYADQAERKSQR